MNDQATATKPAANDKKSATIICNLYNPTPARRVIYDGINVDGKQGQGATQKSITVEPGETKTDVTISREIADELRERNRAKKDSDLQIRPLGTASKDDED